MAELTQDQIVEALTESPELIEGVLPTIIATDKAKEIISNKAESIYTERIGDEVKKIHSQYDNDIFEILGQKPGNDTEGNRVKTYEFNKALLTELKGLRGKAESLTVDSEVQRLTQEIERLKTEGGGKHWQETYENAKASWLKDKEALNEQISTMQKANTDAKIENDIAQGLTGLKFNPDVPEAARKALIDTIKNNLKSNSKIEGDKILYLNQEGKVIQNDEYSPQNAQGILKTALKDILLNENTEPGGGAQAKLKGTIQAKKVDGKDVKELILDESQFKSKAQFNEVATKALASQGISKSNKEYTAILNDAYKRYNVEKLPRV